MVQLGEQKKRKKAVKLTSPRANQRRRLRGEGLGDVNVVIRRLKGQFCFLKETRINSCRPLVSLAQSLGCHDNESVPGTKKTQHEIIFQTNQSHNVLIIIFFHNDPFQEYMSCVFVCQIATNIHNGCICVFTRTQRSPAFSQILQH